MVPFNCIYHVLHKGIEQKLIKPEFFPSWEIVTFDDPQNDLNDLEKNEPYDFLLDGPLKMPNQQ